MAWRFIIADIGTTCICTTEAAARTAAQVGSIQRRVEAQHYEYSTLDLLAAIMHRFDRFAAPSTAFA
jgi:hypothetical protein